MPGPLGAPMPPAAAAAARQAAPPPDTAGPTDVQLPQNFTSRIRALPAQTLVHIPIALRARCTKIWAECMEGLRADLPGWSSLEEARSKLLLMECVPGAHNQTELATRVALWEARDFEVLLLRLEAQHLERAHKPRRRKHFSQAEAQERAVKGKIKRMVGEGAYRKAINSFGSKPATFTPEEEKSWADKLLPKSEAAGHALAPQREAPPRQPVSNLRAPTGQDGEEDNHPLKGVRYTALTAPGPSGMRPEHAKEMLSIRRRPLVNRALRALAAFQEVAAAGSLGLHSRWILRTRLVYLKKRGSDTPRPVRIGEFLRSCMAKRLLRAAAPALRKKLLDMNQ